MTELLYPTDSYLKELECTVTGIEDDAVILDKTIFFPGGGGQPADQGEMSWTGGEAKVEKVKKVGVNVLHWLEGARPNVGDSVSVKLDWDRRYKLMRTHSAMHILCGVIWRDYQAQVTGGNMEPAKGRLDFELESMSADFAERLEPVLNAEVQASRPVRVNILPRDEAFRIPDLIRTKINLLPEGIKQVRTLEIVGLDLQADGGTHVANTEEIGRIRIVGHESKGRINKRIRIVVE